MSEYLYCQTSASQPGLIHIGSAERDPRCKHVSWAAIAPFPGATDFAWVLKVCDAEAAKSALLKTLHPHREKDTLGFYRYDAMAARGQAIRFVTLRGAQESAAETADGSLDLLGTCFVAFAIGQQCLHISVGGTGPTLAMMIAPLYWIARRWSQQGTRRLAR